MNEKEILEWYVSAGVDVICGDEPFVFSEKIKPAVVQKTDTRPAITDLAQMSQAACKNARDICSKAQSLEELEKAVEMFDGCALKLTANKTVFGDGNVHAKIMFVGEAPGADEDRLRKLNTLLLSCPRAVKKGRVSVMNVKSRCLWLIGVAFRLQRYSILFQ